MYLFVELNKLGTTIVIATHDNKLVEKIGASRLHLEDGKLTHISGTKSTENFNSEQSGIKI